MVIPFELRSAGSAVPRTLIPVVGVHLKSYFSDSVLNEWFPLLVTPKDPVGSQLRICKALHAQLLHLVP